MFSLSKSYEEAKNNLDTLLNQVEENNSVVLISRDGHEDIAVIKAKELSSLVESLHLLRSPSNAQKLFEALQRSYERDNNPPATENIEMLCEELGIEREE